MPNFQYTTARLKDIVTHATRSSTGKATVTQVDINGQACTPSKRFWTSLQANYGFSDNMFRYFTHEEVFQRISQTTPNDELRVCIEKGGYVDADDVPQDTHKLLACASTNKAVITHDDLMGVLSKHGMDVSKVDYGGHFRRGGSIDGNGIRVGGIGGPLNQTLDSVSRSPLQGTRINNDWRDQTFDSMGIPQISYDNGMVRSYHEIKNAQTFSLGGDEFTTRFVLDTPIDGYGKPAAYLMLMRQICSNGSIGYSSTFRSEIALGKKEDKFDYALERAIEGFNNEEGFAALKQRFESAQKSWCSINEVNKAYKILVRLHGKSEVRGVKHRYMSDDEDAEGVLMAEGSPIIKSFHKMVGDLRQAYGMSNIDALTIKKQQTLPTGVKMYDMLNFLSEVATHYSTPAGQRTTQALIGDFVGYEYDLEGTADKFGDWKDFLISDKTASDNFQIAQKL